MTTRRNFFRQGVAGLFGLGISLESLYSAAARAFAAVGRVLIPRGTRREDLVNKNPKELDASELEPTPIEDFRTMGQEDHEENLESWRLIVDGSVKNRLELTYSQVLALPSIERKVLLICPGFFVNQGIWKGFSVKELLSRAEPAPNANYLKFEGPQGQRAKVFQVPIKDVLTDKVFLAYRVNGVALPGKHGFPLRVVAEDYYGDDWIKYVYRVSAEVVPSQG